MKRYLRCYVNYLQDDWPTWLSLAEFAANNQMSESTKISLFFANTGWDRRITTDLNPPARGDINDARAHGLASRMAEIHKFATTSIMDAQECSQDQADKQRITAPQLRPGDLVWVLYKHTHSVRLSWKLDHKREGPFRIMEDQYLKTRYAYRVDFPDDIKVHPVRHISEPEPVANDPYLAKSYPHHHRWKSTEKKSGRWKRC